MINLNNLEQLKEQFLSARPFNHIVVDNFFQEDVANKIADEFPAWDSDDWSAFYNSPIEVKKLCSDWNRFKTFTYKAFWYLNSKEFVDKLKFITDNPNLVMDIGMHGGGYHSHISGGKLNVHLDYDLHPKLGLQRKLNIIIYMTKGWDPEWGGSLSLWSGDDKHPITCEKKVYPLFNRAVLFDTTQNSWHGLPEPITCPDGLARNSLAVYYVQPPTEKITTRQRAMFVPSEEQIGNPEIEKLCEERSKFYGS